MDIYINIFDKFIFYQLLIWHMSNFLSMNSLTIHTLQFLSHYLYIKECRVYIKNF